MAITVDLAAMPIIVTGTTDTATVVVDRAMYVRNVYWYKPSTLGHLMSLTDPNGRVVAKGCCALADEGVTIPVFNVFDGLYCDDLDSGEIYIY